MSCTMEIIVYWKFDAKVFSDFIIQPSTAALRAVRVLARDSVGNHIPQARAKEAFLICSDSWSLTDPGGQL